MARELTLLTADAIIEREFPDFDRATLSTDIPDFLASLVPEGDEEASQADMDIWNAAWDRAKASGFAVEG